MKTDALGAFQRRDDRVEVRFERFYPRLAETVWSALTEPGRLADWMGDAHVEPRVGGRYELMRNGPHAMTGRILVWEPPKILEFTWSNPDSADSVARYELFPDRDGTRLILTHTGIPHASSALMLPGWHFFLGRLGRLLEEELPPRSRRGWRELQAIYVDHYALHGSRLEPNTPGARAAARPNSKPDTTRPGPAVEKPRARIETRRKP